MHAIKRLREKAGISQQALAQILNVTQGLISQWELGEVKPRADKLPELAKALGCTIDDLFKPDETPNTQSQ